METTVTCRICGISRGHLCRHIPLAHNMTCAEYGTLFPTAELWSEKFIRTRKPPRLGTSTSAQARENMRSGAKGRKSISDADKLARSNKMKEVLQDPLIRSKRVAQIMKAARNNRYKHGRVYVLDQDVYYRSSYELLGLRILEANKKIISSFKSETIQIPYKALTGETKITVPDWLITLDDGMSYLIEVKPATKLSDADTVIKLQSAEGWAAANNITYCIWTEEVVKNPSSTTTSLKEILKATATTQNGLRYSLNSLVTERSR